MSKLNFIFAAVLSLAPLVERVGTAGANARADQCAGNDATTVRRAGAERPRASTIGSRMPKPM